MKKDITLAMEELRLAKLYSYDILGTTPDINFDRIVQLAAQIFDSPFSQMIFVDRDKVFTKARVGSLPAESDREQSLCALAIGQDDVTVFEDLQGSVSLSGFPLAQLEQIRFYAAAPLRTVEGWLLGALCVMDKSPKKATQQQLNMLETLAAIAMDELDMSLHTRKAMLAQTDMMNRVVHDLKNPNTTISLSAELIKKKSDDVKIVSNFADRIKKSADHALVSLNHLLESSQIENASFRLNLTEIDLCELLAECKRNVTPSAVKKQQEIIITCPYDKTILADRARLTEAFEQLLHNGIMYSPLDTQLSVIVTGTDKAVTIEFRDQGQGLTPADQQLLFMKFAKLSTFPTAAEHRNGLGLPIVKMLVELHRGKVWAISEGKDKGSSFFIELPQG